ncbi:MAG: transglutaminase-like domain-containing protein [Bacteroidia bacterium]|nr:transglutaminase-like domain-containing protein [Bacteroidia bacterium]
MMPIQENDTSRKIQALISLIDDPDETVFTQVKNQLLLLGPVALPYLEKVWNETMNSFIVQRIEEIIEDIKFNELSKDLLHWKYHQQENLLYAVWRINHFQYPEVSFEYLNKKIEQIKKDIWIEFAEDLTALEEVMIINHILYEVHQFAPNIANYNAVQNNYLHYVLENKKGNNISLGILYLLLAQKMELPVFAINIPDYLILTYINDTINLYDASSQSLQDATLFYINPFSKGTLLQKEDIIHFLEQTNMEPEKNFFTPCSNADIAEKLLTSIAHSYKSQGNSFMYNKFIRIAQRLASE